jgi:hypothetical protein
MTKQIKRNSWSRFCKQFSASNQFRPAQVKVKKTRGRKVLSAVDCFPLVGMALAKKGRLIDGIQFFAGRPDVDMPVEPVITIKDPAEVILEQNKAGQDSRLKIRSKDGIEATVEIQQADDLYRELVEKVAYSLYERRGFSHGDDHNDWFEAERKLGEIRRQFAG